MPLRDWQLWGRDRPVIHTVGQRRWWRGTHRSSWMEPRLCLPIHPSVHAAVLCCPAFSSACPLLACSVLADISSLPGVIWEPPSNMLAAVRNWAWAWLSHTFGPSFQCAGSSLSVPCHRSKPAARPCTLPACRRVHVRPRAVCSAHFLAHSRPSMAAFKFFYFASCLLKPFFWFLSFRAQKYRDRVLGTEEFIKSPVRHFSSVRGTSFLLCHLQQRTNYNCL